MKHLQRLLRLANGLLLGAVVIAVIGLVTPAGTIALPDRDTWVRPPKPSDGGRWMHDARNPIESARERIETPVSVELLGTNAPADRTWGFAFLLVSGRHSVTAFVGEEVPELAGWTLTRVTPASATVSNGARELTLEGRR